MSGEHTTLVLGAGGHGKVVLAALLAAGEPPAGVLDDDPGRWGSELLGQLVGGPLASCAAGAAAILAIGDNTTRKRLSAELGCSWRPVVHPQAWVDPSACIGEGAFVAAGAVVLAEATIGAHAIVNTGATVDHDCVVGPFAHLAPGAHLAGGVAVGEGGLVGIGAAVGPAVHIGPWAVLGAGAAAVRDLAAGVTAVGVPARARDDG